MDGIEYGVLTESDCEEMVRLLGEAFARRDPPAVAVGLTPGEFGPFVRLLCAHAASQGLTIVARLVESGEMAGVLLTEDSTSPPPAGIETLSPKFDPIVDILSKLETAYRNTNTYAAGESAHLFLLGVSEQFEGRGIASQLVTQCVANATRKGYRRAVAEATNLTSQHIFRKAGFTERARESYAEHRFCGHAFFPSIAQHGGPILMDKMLAP